MTTQPSWSLSYVQTSNILGFSEVINLFSPLQIQTNKNKNIKLETSGLPPT